MAVWFCRYLENRGAKQSATPVAAERAWVVGLRRKLPWQLPVGVSVAIGVDLSARWDGAPQTIWSGEQLRRSWDWGLDPLKICRRGQSMFWPPKTVILFYSKLSLDNCASFTSSRMKDWRVSKMEGKTNFFRGAWNSLIACPDWPWPPVFYDRSMPLDINIYVSPKCLLAMGSCAYDIVV